METSALSVQQLRDLIDHNSDCLWETDAQGRYTYASRVMTDQLGYAPAAVVGKSPLDFMSAGERERMLPVFSEIIGARRSFQGLINRNLHANGTVVVLETNGIPLFDAQGQLCGFRGISRDISTPGERWLQIEAAYEHAPVGLSIVHISGRIVMGNKSLAQLMGLPVEQVVGADMSELMPAPWKSLTAQLPAPGADLYQPSREMVWKDQWLLVTPQYLPDAKGEVEGLFIAWMDITDRKRTEQQLADANRQLAKYARQDYLTGLPNRRVLDEQLVTEIARARREGQPLSLCMVDVDWFKPYNDNLGHLAGDECLRSLSQVLAQQLRRPADTISRYGGEEFVIILPGTDAAGAQSVAEQMRQQVFAQALPHPTSPFGRVSISVGVVTRMPGAHQATASTQRGHMPHDADLASSLLRQADRALYVAKDNGRNQVACRASTGEIAAA